MCCRSNAIVAPSGSCSSSAFARPAAATMSSKSRASAPSRSITACRSAPRRARGSLPPVITPAYHRPGTWPDSGRARCAQSGQIRQAWRMAADILTLMAVHAHPDDEASSTGGVLALYADQGIRTVVVTCTNGEFGDAPGQVKPGEDGHDEQAVAQLPLAELRQSCKILGVSSLELLGYHDSGMPEWEYKDRPEAFCNVPLDAGAARRSGLIGTYRPQVAVSHDAKGCYHD